MHRIRFILSKQPDPALDEAAIIKRLKEFYTALQDKRQISDGIPQEERAAHNELWRYPQNEHPKALEIQIRRWAQKIHRNHLREVEPTRLSREDRAMLEGDAETAPRYSTCDRRIISTRSQRRFMRSFPGSRKRQPLFGAAFILT